MNKLKKGDKVKVLLGKDRGKEASVDRLMAKTGLVILPGINLYKRHVKRSLSPTGEGTVIEVAKPLKISNVALICPNCGKPTRVGFKLEAQKKVRICRKCKQEIK